MNLLIPAKNKILFLFLIFTIPIAGNLFATNTVKQISNVNGLSNNSVNCVFEDSEQIMWIGTWDGLNVYNGRDIKTFRYVKNDPASISNNIIRQILEQDDQYLWVATDYGVNRWDRNTQQFKRFYLGTEQKVPKQEKAYRIGIANNKMLYCFVNGVGFFVYDSERDTFDPVETDFSDYVDDFIINAQNNLIVRFQNGDVGYLELNTASDNLQLSSFKMINENPAELIFYSQNHLLLYSRSGIEIYNDAIKKIKNIHIETGRKVSDIVKDGENIYISCYNGGCFRYDLSTGYYSLLNNVSENMSVFSLYKGSQDILWLGTDGQGLFQLYDYTYPFRTYATESPVRSFCEYQNSSLLIGTKGSGIRLLDKKTGKITDHLNTDKGLLSNSVYCMTRNKHNDIFIGTEDEGINILYANTNKLHKLNIPYKYPLFKAVYKLHFTNDDSVLWVGTSGYGLIKLELEKQDGLYVVKNFEQYVSSNTANPLNNDIIYAITSDNNNNLWFGTRGGGLNCLNINDNTIKGIEDISSNLQLTNNDILCLSINNNDLWIGTSYGLNRLIMDGGSYSLMQYTEHEGLNNNTIHGMLFDENNNVWLSTNQGISVIGKDGNIKNFNLSDGLQNNEFSDGAYYIDSDNNFYFGGVSGFNEFNPAEMQFRNFKAPLVLNSLKIFNSPQNIHEKIKGNMLKLSYEERYVTLGFIAKDYINNENCEYAYRLKDYSDEWIMLGNNPVIVFSKLPSGRYNLEVKATNGDKIWNDEVYKLTMQIGYPWWLSAPAIIIYIIIILIAIYLTQSIIKSRIRLSRQLFIEQVEMQHQQKMYESKLNFFTNVAHEFFTPLTLIYGPAQHLLEKSDLDSYVKHYLQIIKNNADRMQKLINELMEFRKVKMGYTPFYCEDIDIRLLAEYVSDNYTEMLQENKIDFDVDIRHTSTLYSDRDSLEKIFFNLFSNAFKYTPRSGYIHIKIWQDEANNNALNLTVRNSGKGLTQEQMDEVFDKYKIFDRPSVKNAISTGVGLNLTKSLTELLGGKINVSSRLGEYVEFSVVIPPLNPAIVNTIKKEDAKIPEAVKPKLPEVRYEVRPNILIVEDERNIRELLKDILHADYNIIEASDGKEALDIIRKNHPDIIISDILMPNLDGIKMIDILKGNPKTAHIPVINISAKSSVEDHIDAFKHGADIYITKPFHPKHIFSAVQNLLQKQVQLKEYYNSSISSVLVKDGIVLHEEEEKLLHDINEYIVNNINDESLNPNTIAEFLNISKASLYRKLKELTDKTPSEYVRTIRLEYASKYLKTTKLTVSEIMYKVGFSNRSYFNREFQKQYGLSPKDYRLNETSE